MTREEAIYELKNAAWLGTDHSRARTEEAVDIAIQALSQEPKYRMAYDYADGKARKFAWIWGNGWTEIEQEPCDDAISRKDAEQMFRNIRSHLKPQDYKSAEEFNTRDLMLLNAEQMIHALPSVTQKSGKWIKWRETEDIPRCKCSECDTEYDIFASRFINYCPNCGARMAESEE